MSWKLVSEVLTYTEDLPARDRLILVTVAEEAREHTRTCTPGPGVLAQRVGLSRRGLRRAMQRLASRGLDPRVPLMNGADGRPVFAVPGTLQSYRVPELAPSEQVSEGGTPVPPGGTDVPPGDHAEGRHAVQGWPPGDTRRVRQGSPGGPARGPRRVTPSPVPGPETPPPTPTGDDDGLDVDELERVVVGVLRKTKTPVPGRNELRKQCSRLARLQWTAAQLHAVVEGHDWSGARAGAVISFLRQLQAPGTAQEAAQDRPPWCGACNETTRQIEDPETRVPRRCPICHPSTRRDTA